MAPHRFEPGNKFGVHRGRPKLGVALADKVRAMAGEDGHIYLEQLHLIATAAHKDVRARMAAIEILLDRGWGKPLQELDVSYRGDQTDPETASDAELQARAKLLVQQLTDLAEAERLAAERDGLTHPNGTH